MVTHTQLLNLAIALRAEHVLTRSDRPFESPSGSCASSRPFWRGGWPGPSDQSVDNSIYRICWWDARRHTRRRSGHWNIDVQRQELWLFVSMAQAGFLSTCANIKYWNERHTDTCSRWGTLYVWQDYFTKMVSSQKPYYKLTAILCS